jgi:hypothetical protein
MKGSGTSLLSTKNQPTQSLISANTYVERRWAIYMTKGFPIEREDNEKTKSPGYRT